MDKISYADFRRTAASELVKRMPLAVTMEGETAFYAVRGEDVVVVGDLHIRVRNRIRALINRARFGMGQAHVLTLDEMRSPEPESVKES